MASRGLPTMLSVASRPLRSTPSIPPAPVTSFTAPMRLPLAPALRLTMPCRLHRPRRRSSAPGRVGALEFQPLKTVSHSKGTANENHRKDTRPGAAGGPGGPFSHGGAGSGAADVRGDRASEEDNQRYG